jgi:transcriptional regulator with XRE-family HTH domain|tara:strand:+ start:54 stop:434 length:381 start_codon:yes stop_codon:yes gene_type:complete
MPDAQRGHKKTADDIAFNAVVGRNIKYLRKYRRLNQTKVADYCKVKFQQLQKYEKGTNGCSAYRLQQLAKFFKVGLDVLVDPNMITKHRGFASYQDQIDSDVEIDKLLTEQEIIEKYKRSVGHKCP